MTLARPCSCDRFAPGAAYVAGRDCARCWMFAHRPEVRAAWGGNPDDCDTHFRARRTMPVGELAELLAGPPAAMPDGWRFWPVARAAHLLLAERFAAAIPPYPEGRFAGHGAVICGGGKYEACTYVACRMLRHVGWRHPIQVWHRGAAEPVSARVRRLPGVEVIDAAAHPEWTKRRMTGGWESKLFAVINSPFEEVLWLDADCYPIYDPDECFRPENNPHGIVIWPDNPVADNAIHWPTYGFESDGGTGLNGGHYVFTKRRAWGTIQFAAHLDDHSDYYYWRTTENVRIGAFSDQEHLRIALRKIGTPYHRYAARPLACVAGSYIQAGPGGRTLFVHRFFNKFALPDEFPYPPSWQPGVLPMDAIAWRYFLEWLTDSRDEDAADEAPGRFTRAEFELWRKACADRDVLELGRDGGRSTVAAALSARKVVSLDRASAAPVELWLQRYGVWHKVWLREGEFADLIATSGGPFSACLLDGAAVNAIANAVPHLSPGALIGFRDYPDAKEVVDAEARARGWAIVERADRLAVFATALLSPKS